jgi:hypothetical protein
VPLPPDYFTPRSLLAATVWNLATRHGQLDLTFAPSGFPGGYGELAPRAEHLTVAGTRIAVPVAARDDIHKSKRAADRPKDRAYFLAARRTRPRIADLRALRRSSRTSAGKELTRREPVVDRSGPLGSSLVFHATQVRRARPPEARANSEAGPARRWCQPLSRQPLADRPTRHEWWLARPEASPQGRLVGWVRSGCSESFR